MSKQTTSYKYNLAFKIIATMLVATLGELSTWLMLKEIITSSHHWGYFIVLGFYVAFWGVLFFVIWKLTDD